ncbi:AIPR family protein [Spirulina major CS-329]|uniref:AIPR family protein n=1 Tax=Spirulina TaxID=1154 RepID=UPI002330D128|nr:MULTISPECIES: AIPR family protein [Spirulina]MDB9493538.1 AIPR family protein [Spirulina subsalsa CS-330]MDB9503850.1 AIPR family protein [Spirulina major CS-329]
MKYSDPVKHHSRVRFTYYSFRNISCPEDTENQRKVLSGHAPIEAIVDLPTNENVRDYLLGAEGRQRKTPTAVHRAIRDTLTNYPDKFSILNGGVVIVARGYEVNEKSKELFLDEPSIINGSQTQGILKDYLRDVENEKSGETLPDIHITFELIITSDESLIAEISIARNFQNDVKLLSISGRLGELDELDQSIQSNLPGKKLRTSETELSEKYLDTERLLQVITALIPPELWVKDKDGDFPNKTFTYSQKARCLKDFREIYKSAKSTDSEKSPNKKRYEELYKFYLDIAPQAYQLHKKWKTHQGFQGTGLRCISRDGRDVIDIPDGIIFPILASLSVFAKKQNGKWTIEAPSLFSDKEIIASAKTAYQQIAGSKPHLMGRSKACYSQLLQVTSIYKRVSSQQVQT